MGYYMATLSHIVMYVAQYTLCDTLGVRGVRGGARLMAYREREGGVCQEKFGRVEIYIRLFCKNSKIRTIDKSK